MKNINLFLCLLFITLVFSGCSNKVSMRGKVTFSDDQSPLTTGAVTFQSGDYVAKGILKPDGTYVLGSTSTKDGLPPGEYQVFVNGAVKVEEQRVGGTAMGGVSVGITIPLIDAKYADPSTSGLVVKVDRRTKRFDFTVERP